MVIAVMVVVAAVPATAAATERGGTGRVVAPSRSFDGVDGADAIGIGWRSSLSVPSAELGPRCIPLGRHRNALLALSPTPPVECTVARGTAIFVLGITQIQIDPVSDRVRAGHQRRQALTDLRNDWNGPVDFTVDGRPKADLHSDRYLTCSPQQRIVVPPGNGFDVSPGPKTVVACGFVAWLVDLPPGQHTLQATATGVEGSHDWTAVITVR